MKCPFAPIRGRALKAKRTSSSVTSPLAGEGQGGGEPMHRANVHTPSAHPQRPWPIIRLTHLALEHTP